jgi:hypothetical protein
LPLDWITILLATVCVWSLVQGARRGLAVEAGYLVNQLVGLGAGITALWCAWKGSRSLALMAQSAPTARMPDWAAQIVQAWQHTPQVAQALVFLCIYLLVSTLLQALLRALPATVAKLFPRELARSRWLGALLGALAGAARAVIYGGLLFLCMQYVSWPWLTAQARQSGVYEILQKQVYQPWLEPVAQRELPVLTKEALEPIAENISLFALPTGAKGQVQGMLIVPQQIAQLAKQITAHQQTDRDKAHALYEWEIHHIRYDWKKYDDFVYRHQWDEQSPLQTLQTGKGVCADFALLYADLAHAAGLPVRIEEGLGGTGPNLGPHAWNEVWDHSARRWIPVDCTWGSQQDAWFDPPDFAATHHAQTVISIAASRRL